MSPLELQFSDTGRHVQGKVEACSLGSLPLPGLELKHRAGGCGVVRVVAGPPAKQGLEDTHQLHPFLLLTPLCSDCLELRPEVRILPCKAVNQGGPTAMRHELQCVEGIAVVHFA